MSAASGAFLSQPLAAMQAFMGERINRIPAIRAFHEISFLQLDLKPEPRRIEKLGNKVRGLWTDGDDSSDIASRLNSLNFKVIKPFSHFPPTRGLAP
jgi:hypothetical protein